MSTSSSLVATISSRLEGQKVGGGWFCRVACRPAFTDLPPRTPKKARTFQLEQVTPVILVGARQDRPGTACQPHIVTRFVGRDRQRWKTALRKSPRCRPLCLRGRFRFRGCVADAPAQEGVQKPASPPTRRRRCGVAASGSPRGQQCAGKLISMVDLANEARQSAASQSAGSIRSERPRAHSRKNRTARSTAVFNSSSPSVLSTGSPA